VYDNLETNNNALAVVLDKELPKKEEVIEQFRIPCNYRHFDLCMSPIIVKILRSGRL